MEERRSLPAAEVALLSAVAIVWGFNFVPIRWALDEIPPFMLAAIRFLLAAVPMVFFVRRPRLPWGYVVGYGLAIGAGQFGLLFLAIKLGFPAGLASLLIQVQVFFTIALAAVLANDRPRPPQVAGACIATLGVTVLAAERISNGAQGNIVGLGLVVAAAICWAVGNVTAKVAAQRHGIEMFSLVVWSSLAAPLPLFALSYATEGGAEAWRTLADASLVAWGSVLFMSYVATLFGFAVWNRMLHRHPAGIVAPFALLVPVVGILSAALFLHEPFGGLEVAAAGLVLLGLTVTVLAKGERKPAFPEEPLRPG